MYLKIYHEKLTHVLHIMSLQLLLEMYLLDKCNRLLFNESGLNGFKLAYRLMVFTSERTFLVNTAYDFKSTFEVEVEISGFKISFIHF